MINWSVLSCVGDFFVDLVSVKLFRDELWWAGLWVWFQYKKWRFLFFCACALLIIAIGRAVGVVPVGKVLVNKFITDLLLLGVDSTFCMFFVVVLFLILAVV